MKRRLYSDRRLASLLADLCGKERASGREDICVACVTRRPERLEQALLKIRPGLERLPAVKGARAWDAAGVTLALLLPIGPALRGWRPSVLLIDQLEREDLLNAAVVDRLLLWQGRAVQTYGSLEQARKRLV